MLTTLLKGDTVLYSLRLNTINKICGAT